MNVNKYVVTKHAHNRYIERVNVVKAPSKIDQAILKCLKDARFLYKEDDAREHWFNDLEQMVIVIDVVDQKVITLYKTNTNTTQINYTARKIVSDYVSSNIQNIKMNNYTHLQSMYQEYASRLDSLSRTFRPDMFEKKEKELIELKAKIDMWEKRYNDTYESLDRFILNNLN